MKTHQIALMPIFGAFVLSALTRIASLSGKRSALAPIARRVLQQHDRR